MSDNFSNNLSDEELERLAILAEEAAEVQQIAMKIIRHGYESVNPNDEEITSNRELLENELGDLTFAMGLMMANDDIDQKAIQKAKWAKKKRIAQYLHHNDL
jgi:phosphoribosyl-ATP pyrophosphohydrolase